MKILGRQDRRVLFCTHYLRPRSYPYKNGLTYKLWRHPCVNRILFIYLCTYLLFDIDPNPLLLCIVGFCQNLFSSFFLSSQTCVNPSWAALVTESNENFVFWGKLSSRFDTDFSNLILRRYKLKKAQQTADWFVQDC